MNDRPRYSILSNVSSSDLALEPYPHLVVENAIDAEVFSELERTFPADDIVVDNRPLKDTWYDYPACKVVNDARLTPLWREFFRYHTSTAFFHELVLVAGDAMRNINPDLEARIGRTLAEAKVGMRPGGRGDPLAPGADVSMECQFYVNYTRQPRVVRGPHVDRPSELFAALFYFRQHEDMSEGGGLQICEATSVILREPRSVRIAELPAEIDPKCARVVRPVPYKANTLVLFLNSERSLHSVAPRSATPLTRRHVNFCCDINSELFDIRLPPRLKFKKILEDTPVAWRLARYV